MHSISMRSIRSGRVANEHSRPAVRSTPRVVALKAAVGEESLHASQGKFAGIEMIDTLDPQRISTRDSGFVAASGRDCIGLQPWIAQWKARFSTFRGSAPVLEDAVASMTSFRLPEQRVTSGSPSQIPSNRR